MDFIDRLHTIAARLQTQLHLVCTEEAVKNAFVMPFISALGYDPFDPSEVVPEMIADLGVKKGEKVDYAIMQDGKVAMLVECKQVGAPLEAKHVGQLYRYFSVTEAKFGVLTDGVRYLFYTDLDTPNVMDTRPFFEFNLREFEATDVEYLKRFSKSFFDVASITGAASEMRSLKALKDELQQEWIRPSEDLVKMLYGRVVPTGRFTAQVKEAFTALTSRAIEENLRDLIRQRLDAAAAFHAPKLVESPTATTATLEGYDTLESDAQKVITTPEEEGAYRIIQAIASEITDPENITIRDAQAYCAILFKDNNRRPIARLYFNRKRSLKVGIFMGGVETKLDIHRITELTQYKETINLSVSQYLDS